MMRAMREITKPVFWVVAISFIGWMAYGQITDILGGGKDIVLKVDGTIVRSQPFQQQYQATLEQYRRQQGGGRLTREDERQVQEDQTFQTNGQFDITKRQRSIASAGSEFAGQVEQLYRDYLPQRKLEEYLTADVYVSDAKLWRIWRDQHESVTVALLAVHPEDVADSLAPVSDSELERYYGAHQADFKRPAGAWLSYVELPRVPHAADSAAAWAHARGLRAEIATGKAK